MERIVETDKRPEIVVVETLPEGKKRVLLRKNIASQARGAGEFQDGTTFVADEVEFDLPSGREDSAADILNSFDDWWEYGRKWTGKDEMPSVEERIDAMENAFAALLEGGVI